LGWSAAYGTLALGLEKLVALGIALYLPRHLGLADYGHYVFLVSWLGLFQVLPDASLEMVAVTRLARGGGAPLAGRAALVRAAVSLGGAALGLVLLALVTRDLALVGAGAMGALGLAALAATPYRMLLRAGLRMGRYAALLAAQAALAVGLLATVVRAGGGLVAVLGATSAASVAALVFGRLLVGPGARLAADRVLARGLVAEAWPLAATTVALVSAQQVLQLLLLRLHGAGEIGLLGGAQKLVEAVGLLPQALMLSVLPALGRAAAAPPAAVAAARDAARLLVVAVLPAAAVLWLWAEALLSGLFGAPFAAAAPVLRVLAPVTLLGTTGSVLSALLVALGLQGVLLRVSAGSALTMVALGAALVPGHGALGAAFALVMGLFGGQVALLGVVATRAHVRPVLDGVLRPLALGVLATAVVGALGAPLAGGVVVLAVAYPAALLATGTITRADLVRWRG
jgi:O-antigen/teichoic acid export membrane protein